jgi:nitroreductase
MDAIDVLTTRRCVRKFDTKEVPRELIEKIVDCGRLAATAINIQPWEFVVVTNPKRLRAIADITDHGKFIVAAKACIVVLCRDTKYYLEDGSAATQNLLLAAKAYGLGACWVAGDKKAYAGKICNLLGARPEFRLVSLVPLGFPAEDPVKSKRALSEVLHWEELSEDQNTAKQ